MTISNSLPKSLRHLIDEIRNTPQITPASSRQILSQADIDVADLEPWADFDHPAADSYGRKLVYDGGFFELMVMSWNVGDMAAIHDHGCAQWGAVRVFGQIEHAVFKIAAGVLRTCDRRLFSPGSVLSVSHDMIHQMGNMGWQPYLTLHLYGSYDRRGGVTSDARLYDFDECRIQLTNGGVFFNLPESEINCREPAPETDFGTRLRFKVELLKRLATSHDSFRRRSLRSDRAARLASELFAASTWEPLVWEIAEDAAPGDRATGILHQELRAAAALQEKLLAAGLVEADLDARRLDELLVLEDLSDFADGYLELLAETHNLNLLQSVA